jgi:hypothetical protein
MCGWARGFTPSPPKGRGWGEQLYFWQGVNRRSGRVKARAGARPALPASALTRPARWFGLAGMGLAPLAPSRRFRAVHAAAALAADFGVQSFCCATMALRIVSSLRRQAMMATLASLPRSISCV